MPIRRGWNILYDGSFNAQGVVDVDDDEDDVAETTADEDEDDRVKCRRCVHDEDDDAPVARDAAAAAKRHNISVWRVIGDGTTGSTNVDRHLVKLGRRGF